MRISNGATPSHLARIRAKKKNSKRSSRADSIPVATTRNGVRVFAPAKINLFLHVGGKRPDGYHDLQSLVTFVEAGDALEIDAADSLSLELGGAFGQALARDADNLVLKSARVLGESVGMEPHGRIRLTKN